MVGLLAFVLPSPAFSQTYTLAPSPHLVALNNSGTIISSGCIWTYLTGTSTEAATYTTSSGTQNANPIIADSAGRFVAFLQPGTVYRFVYENTPCSASSHGTVLATRDGIAAVPTRGLNVDVTGTAGETLTLADLIYLSDGSGGLDAGEWYRADADNTYSSITATSVGFATAAAAANGTVTVRIGGRMTGLSLTAGEIYYASATAAALASTPPTNARCVGKADGTTSIILPCDTPDVRLPDSDGTHSLVVTTTSDLTADRLLTLAPGDAARTVTISGNATISQDYSTTAAPSFNAFRTPQGRCTLTSATPVTSADVTAATTLRYALYGGNQITLYDGSTRWVQMAFTELSLAVPATTNTMYDVFVDYTAGVPALEAVAWTNDTTRATALALQNGVYVQTSDTDSLYVCSFRTTAVSGQTEDSYARRLVWNYYNRVERPLRVFDTTATWTYSVATIRQANGAATNQVDVVIGVDGAAMLNLTVMALSSNNNANIERRIHIGEDSTTTAMTVALSNRVTVTAANEEVTHVVVLRHYPAVGRHFYAWLEWSTATVTTTWNGVPIGAANSQSGLVGSIEG